MRSVSFKTVGCRLNQAETAQMAAGFVARGYRVVPFDQPADVCVIHTCAITQTAERKSVHYTRTARRKCPDSIIVLAGCAVALHREALLERTGADLAVGQKDKTRIAELVSEVAPLPAHEALTYPALLPVFERTRAIVKVQDGCSFRCAYCVVPDARGEPSSRPFEEIIEESCRLAESGFREIVLTGANLGCYRDGDRRLTDIIDGLEDIPDIARIRLSSIESTTVEREVIDMMLHSEKLCRYIHLPLQSADDGILEAMGRRYRAAEFRSLVEYAVQKVPALGLGTDVLTGFPGESEAAFENTMMFISDLPFNNLHVFPYSSRPGTPAATMGNQVPRKERKRRADLLIRLGEDKRRAFVESFVGTPVSLLTETIQEDGFAFGWTSEYVQARIHGKRLAENNIVHFVPDSVEGMTLTGVSG